MNSPEPKREPETVPICGTCKFWNPDTVGTGRKVWGLCVYGLPERVTIGSRMTTDMSQCSGWERKDA